MLYYYLPIALQVFCFYHAYRNGKEIYWYFIIFFVPLFGSAIYLLIHFLNKNNTQKIGEELTSAINPSKKISDLTEQVSFADTFSNRVALADALLAKKQYAEALENYEKAIHGAHKKDVYVREQLVIVHYRLGNYEKVIEIAKSLKANSEITAAKTELHLGLAYKALKKFNNAEKHLKDLDSRYSNYPERLILAQFLVERDKKNEAMELLNELLEEHSHMSKINKKLHRTTFIEIKKLHQSLL